MTTPGRLLVGTKLEIPKVQGRVIARPRLLRRLKENADRRLVLVCAGAGYGKTTLVGQFCAELNDPVVYYDLDASDGDIVTFFAYLIHGLQSKFPDFDRSVGNLMRETESIEITVGAFINEVLRTVDRDLYLVLDDYHQLQPSRLIDQALDYLLTRSPANLHLIIISRTRPGLNLEYYLAKQSAWIMGTDQLAFRHDEVVALLRDGCGLSLTENEISQVMRHAEGWITAIQLILQRIESAGYESVRETLNECLTRGEDLFSYFARQVVRSLSATMRSFLSGIAYLDWMTPEICDRLLQTKNSAGLLKRLESENLYITRSGKETYRFHPLFQTFLQESLGRESPGTSAGSAFARIGRVFEAIGDVETAADYYLKGGDFNHARRAVKTVGASLLQSCRFNRLSAWLERFPEGHLEKEPELLNLMADLCWHTVKPDAAVALFEKAARIAKRQNQARPLFRAYYGLARLQANRGRFKQALSFLKQARRLARHRTSEIVDTRNLEGVCRIYLGDFEGAEEAFNAAVKLNTGLGRNHSLMNNMAILAFTKGELEKSVRLFKDLARLRPSLLGEANTHSNIALALIDMGRTSPAREHIAKAYWSSRRLNNARGLLAYLIALAFYYAETRNYQKAIQYFARLIRIAEEKNETLFVDRARYGLAKAYYLDGQYEPAEHVLLELINQGRAAYGIRNHDVYMTMGLIQMKLGKQEEAQKTLLRTLRLVENTPFKYSLMRNHYHLASFYHATGKIHRVNTHLSKALQMAQVDDYRYFLKKTAESDSRLLEYAINRGIAREFAQSILDTVSDQSAIRVFLFGDLRVWIEGKEIPSSNWITNKAKLVFAYVVMNRTRHVTKEDLMARFARRPDPRRADQDIRTTMARIQKALGGRRIIAYRRGVYSIGAHVDLKTDVGEFELGVRPVLSIQSGSRGIIPDDLETALKIYRDDFLVEFYDDWSVEQRARLRSLYVRASRIAADACLKQGHAEKAESLSRRILDREPTDLPARLTLIRALARQGLKDQVQTYYRQYLKLAGKSRRDLPLETILAQDTLLSTDNLKKTTK